MINLVFAFFLREGFNILGISFMWYSLIGAVITVVVGALVSLITCPQHPSKLNPKLVFPCIRRWVGKGLEKRFVDFLKLL